jgi:protein-tyrosine-phosphatase
VLFVCLGNSCRSPMAEAIARRNAPDVIEASSAGVAPLGFVAEMTKRVLADNRYSSAGLKSKPILPESWDAADVVINMTGRSRQQVFREYGKVEDWEVQDPYGAALPVYQSICEEIESRVNALAERLRKGSRAMGTEAAERKED